jgi:hypothetical protein
MIIGKQSYEDATCEDCGAKPQIEHHMGLPYYDVEKWMLYYPHKDVIHTKCPSCVQILFQGSDEVKHGNLKTTV